jgi:hypothetical protein
MLRKSSWKVFLMILGFAATMQAFAAQGGDRNGSMVQAADSANAVDLQGVVDSITMGFGQGTPSFALSVPGRGVVTIYVGSYRAWTATNFELKTGMSVTRRRIGSDGATPERAGPRSRVGARVGCGSRRSSMRQGRSAGQSGRQDLARGLRGRCQHGVRAGIPKLHAPHRGRGCHHRGESLPCAGGCGFCSQCRQQDVGSCVPFKPL